MILRNSITSYFSCALVALAACSLSGLQADVVEIDDGARLTGTIVSISDTELVLETSYAGKLTIARDRIATFATDDPVFVRLESGTTFVGRVERENEQAVRIIGQDGVLTAQTDRIVASWGVDARDPEIARAEAALAAKERHWKFQVAVDVSGRSGNSDRFNSTLRASAELESDQDKLRFYGSYDVGEADGVKSADEAIAGASYTAYFHKRLGWYARGELERDEFENIDFRTTVAGGLSYRFLNAEHHTLEGRAGLGYRYENFVGGTSKDDPTIDLGLAHMWQFAVWGRMQNEITYQPVLGDFSDFRLTQDSGLEFPLGRWDWWVLRLGIANTYNSEVGAGIETLDTSYYTRMILTWE